MFQGLTCLADADEYGNDDSDGEHYPRDLPQFEYGVQEIVHGSLFILCEVSPAAGFGRRRVTRLLPGYSVAARSYQTDCSALKKGCQYFFGQFPFSRQIA